MALACQAQTCLTGAPAITRLLKNILLSGPPAEPARCRAAGANRGLSSDKQLKQDILRLVDVLQQESAGQETTAGPISATWRLLWTTEKVPGVAAAHERST